MPGGVRRIPLLVDGWFYALPLPRLRLTAITRVIPPFSKSLAGEQISLRGTGPGADWSAVRQVPHEKRTG